jgi:hypothetical protein
MRIFVTTPVVKGGSSILSWLLGQHSYLNHSPLVEMIELGAMLNVLDHVPRWIRDLGPHGQSAGKPEILDKIRNFTDDLINPHDHPYAAVKFTNFSSYQWLRHVFPNDRIVVIVRDLADWYASVKGWNTTRHGGWTIGMVDRLITLSASSLRDLPDIKIVHLEDLIHRPHDTMALVHSYLGLPIEPISLIGQEQIFSSYSSDPTSYSAPPSEALISSPIGRKNALTIEERLHVDRINKNNRLIAEVLYSDSRRLFHADL